LVQLIVWNNGLTRLTKALAAHPWKIGLVPNLVRDAFAEHTIVNVEMRSDSFPELFAAVRALEAHAFKIFTDARYWQVIDSSIVDVTPALKLDREPYKMRWEPENYGRTLS
jgi:hypothetical protein